MNKKPVYYSQHDRRWADWPYQAPGERDTISNSGCGPACAAMLIETLTGKPYTPVDAAWWAREHGYKEPRHGTNYHYFEAQFAAVGLSCRMLRWSNAYHDPGHPNHAEARRLMKQGYYIIACMGPGNWTNGGHFVVVWWEDNKLRINDPNSTRPNRTNGDPDVFYNEVKYYWAVDARTYNGMMPDHEPDKEDGEMSREEIERIAKAAAREAAVETIKEIEAERAQHPGSWEKPFMDRAGRLGLCDGTRPRAAMTRGETSAMMCSMADKMLEVANAIRRVFGEGEGA